MPRNRREVDRNVKLDEVLVVAEDLLRAGGYDALSFTTVAERLDIARGAVYWYFPTKDALFVAAAARMFDQALANPPVRAGYLRRIEWGVDQLAELQPLNLALHDRSQHSPEVRELKALVENEMCFRLHDVLRSEVPPARLEPVALTIVVFVQGLLTTPHTASERRRLLRFIVGELVQ